MAKFMHCRHFLNIRQSVLSLYRVCSTHGTVNLSKYISHRCISRDYFKSSEQFKQKLVDFSFGYRLVKPFSTETSRASTGSASVSPSTGTENIRPKTVTYADLCSASNVPEIFAKFEKETTNPYEIHHILRRLTDICKTSDCDSDLNEKAVINIYTNQQYQDMVKVLDKNVLSLNYKLILNCLNSIMCLHPNEDVPIINSLQAQVLWLMRKMSTTQLFHVIETYLGKTTTESRKEIYEDALNNLLRRWVEISDPSIIISLLYYLRPGQEKYVPNLETRALDLCEQMKIKDLYRLLSLLSKHEQRNAPLIRAVIYHMKKQKDLSSLSLQHLINLVHALAKFNIYDGQLIQIWTDAILSRTSEFTANEPSVKSIIAMLQSVGTLRCSNGGLFSLLMTNLAMKEQQLGFKDISTALWACATVNHIPANLNKIQQNFLASNLKSDNPRIIVDFLWNLAILQGLSGCDDVLDQVFQEEFINRIKEKVPEQHQATTLMKLLNIHTAAKYDLQGSTNVSLSSDVLSNTDIKLPIRHKRPTLEEVVKTLNQMAPGDKYLALDVLNPLGYSVDIEMCINSKADCLPLNTGTNDPSIYRVAIKILEFQDMLLGSSNPIGRYQMMWRHLEKDGYKVIMIPHFEFSKLDTTVKQVQYLQNKLKEAVA